MSKGMDRLEVIKETLKVNSTSEKTGNYVNHITEPIEKELKALEIIKEKNVDIFWLYHTLTMVKFEGIIDGCKYYNNYHAPNCVVDNNLKTIRNENLAKLTQEEYELLKEVLVDEMR